MKIRSFRWPWVTLVFALVPVRAGRASQPDASSFPEQINLVASGVNAGYTLSQDSVTTVSPEQCRTFSTAWGPIATTRSAVVAYSQAVASLADHRNKVADVGEALATAPGGGASSRG